MFIQTEATSDPHLLRFLPGRPVLPFGTAEFPDAGACGRSPLARALFAVDGVVGVTLETDAIAVRKRDDLAWYVLKPPIFGVIMDHFSAGAPALRDPAPAEAGDRLAERIEALLAERIRPALAETGGEVVLRGIDDAEAVLELRGGVPGMPLFALKIRIENTLRQALPDIAGVRFATPGHAVDPPAAAPDGAAARAVQRLLDESINPAIAAHGGYIMLVEVRDGAAYVRLEGGCQGCGMSEVTLRQGVEAAIRAEVPEITEVRDVTDHGAGGNPYYRADG